ncbi:SusD/RagB family nutrient-binding outer membrane lipoprotein [Catalinimonas niigatensis]|uniref:SusD/RagB family nutrient-binding outer membrane lipoprotein n=1 Tax=Catalinimonas niigatensis TaxID=1397264 RepID=UPI00266626E9|nr:SusD/RagB family nutrient-binding outer membrane lipoprotein [Catalinimonas niigatensis]WPP51912.1 SusD/RagB family nutrient-binding outer membrane lipoprotein [Catalinimonas niigatensis]
MKNILQNITILGFLLCFLLSCSDDTLDKINENPNAPIDVPVSLLLPQATISTIHGVAGDGGGEYASLFVEHATNVHLNPRRPEDVNSNVWSSTYNTLNDLKIIIDKGSEGGSEEGQYIAVGIAKVLYAYTLSVGTDFFGDVPHSEALQGSLNRSPIFDNQQTIYAFLQQTLDEAIVDLDRESIGNAAQIDLIFQGDREMWKKTAYALKARLHNRLSNIDPASSAQDALDALNNAFTSAEEGFIFEGYLSGTSNDNPWAGWQKQEQTYAVSETFIDLINSFNEPGFVDPRAERWFTKIEGEFVGAPSGNAQSDLTHSVYSAPSTETVLYDEAPQPLLTYDEMKFIESEAHLRLGNRPEANAAYEEAVQAALRRSGISEEEIMSYVNQGIVFPGEADLTLEHIIRQKNVSFWMFQSLEAYNDFRRTGIPQMSDPRGTPLRLPYPPSEVNRNPNTPSEINDITIYEMPVWWGTSLN